MANLANRLYDPVTAVTWATTAALAMTAMDTTNLRNTFTVPANGRVMVRMMCTVHGAATFPSILLGILQGSTVIARVSPIGGLKNTAVATAHVTQEATFVVSGLTPGASLSWDMAYGVETAVTSSAIKCGGPNNTTSNDAFGAAIFEIWEA